MPTERRPESTHTRRAVLRGGSLLASAIAVDAMAGGVARAAERDHDHPARSGTWPHVVDASDLAAIAQRCIADGEACLAHCFQRFQAGDTSMATCALAVDEMLVACRMLSRFATRDSRHLSKVAQLCISICVACEEACRKHAKHHDVCRRCADSCRECADACREHRARF